MSRTRNIELIRGEEFVFGFRLRFPTFDWTGIAIRCQLRTLDGRLVWDFLAEGGIASGVETDGTLSIALTAPGLETARWPTGRLEAHVEVEKASVGWGPYVPLKLRIQVGKDITR